MNLLALETSGAQPALAALELERGVAMPRAVRVLDEPRHLSQNLIPAIDALLQEAGWKLADVEALAVGLGPGSWTGLRIGLSTAKTLAQVRQWPLAAVPTFDALAQAVWRNVQDDDGEGDEDGQEDGEDETNDEESEADEESRLLLVTMKCRPGEVYGKLFECHPDYLAVIQSEWIGSPEMMAGALSAESLSRCVSGMPLLVGDAAELVATELREPSLNVEVTIEQVVVELALAGAVALESGEASDPLEVQPLYLAPSAAERNLTLPRGR